MRIAVPIMIAVLLLLLQACQSQEIDTQKSGQIQEAAYGTATTGEPITMYTLTNDQGMEAKIINYGAILVSLKTADRTGAIDDITLGYDTLEGYVNDASYFGATVGRCASYIASAAFVLDGVRYDLSQNRAPGHLHGGFEGFNKVVWDVQKATMDYGSSITMTHVSPDGTEGYPGTLSVTTSYTLTGKNELVIEATAETDRPTPVNLTHHSYFNLGGQASGDILDEVLTIPASRRLDAGGIQTVQATPWDFREAHVIGERIDDADGEYDLVYVLDKPEEELTHAAELYDPASGRQMDVFTTKPCLILYTANFLDGSTAGKGGYRYQKYGALCLEAIYYADAANHPEYPSIILKPGRQYYEKTVYAFSTR